MKEGESSLDHPEYLSEPEYTHHLRHDGIAPADRVPSLEPPELCPEYEQPSKVHDMVINLEGATARLQQRFRALGLPMFQRIRGIVAQKGVGHDMPQSLTQFAVALAHRDAWKAAFNGHKP